MGRQVSREYSILGGHHQGGLHGTRCKPATPVKQQSKTPGKEPNSPSQFQLGKPIQGRSVAKVMKDGTKICQSFQHKQCKGPKTGCPNGAHRCGSVLRGERVCGAPGHGAAECRAKTRA